MAATIEIRPNGPYLVKGDVALTNENGVTVTPAIPNFALCRCGGSMNKPFCDATHRKNGFSGARISDGSNDKVTSYRGPGITIHDNRSICSHVGYCTDGLPAVFREAKPWIDPAGAPIAAIVEAVRKCPSGALSYTLDGAQSAKEPLAPAIAVTKDGPYAVTGDVELLNAQWAQGASKDRYTLCRCGASRNKPLCDGTHWEIGFKDGV